MTRSERFRRACSLRVPKSPALLDDSGGFCGSLEESSHPWEAEEATLGGSPGLGQAQKAARNKGSCGHQAASLKVSEKDAVQVGEAIHALGPGDKQPLVGEAHGKAGGRLQQCQKQVSRALQQRWETISSSMYSLMLSRSACPAASRWPRLKREPKEGPSPPRRDPQPAARVEQRPTALTRDSSHWSLSSVPPSL